MYFIKKLHTTLDYLNGNRIGSNIKKKINQGIDDDFLIYDYHHVKEYSKQHKNKNLTITLESMNHNLRICNNNPKECHRMIDELTVNVGKIIASEDVQK